MKNPISTIGLTLEEDLLDERSDIATQCMRRQRCYQVGKSRGDGWQVVVVVQYLSSLSKSYDLYDTSHGFLNRIGGNKAPY
jgi:hypothetical protein